MHTQRGTDANTEPISMKISNALLHSCKNPTPFERKLLEPQKVRLGDKFDVQFKLPTCSSQRSSQRCGKASKPNPVIGSQARPPNKSIHKTHTRSDAEYRYSIYQQPADKRTRYLNSAKLLLIRPLPAFLEGWDTLERLPNQPTNQPTPSPCE
jgi:hypothetical protein